MIKNKRLIFFLFLLVSGLMFAVDVSAIKRGASWDEVTNDDSSKTRTYYAGQVNVFNGTEYVPFNDIVDVSFNKQTGILRYSYKEYYIDAMLFLVVNVSESVCNNQGWTWWNNNCTMFAEDARQFIIDNNISFDIVVDEYRTKYKYAINLSNIPSAYTDKLLYVGLRLENTSGLTWGDISLLNQSVYIKGKIKLDYSDLIESNFTVSLYDKRTVLIGNVKDKDYLWLDPTVSYNFSAIYEAINMFAYENTGVNDPIPPANNLHPASGESNITTSAGLDADDESYESVALAGVFGDNEAYHLFEAHTEQTNIDDGNWTWNGKTSYPDIYLYVWNFTAGSWKECDTTDSTYDVTKVCSIMDDLYNTSNGESYFLMYSSNPSGSTQTIYTDYVELRITYTLTEINISQESFNTSSINSGQTIRLNTTVTSTGTIDQVWAEFMYPNGTLENNTMYNITASVYSLVWNETEQLGQYNITQICANTTDGTLNYTDYSSDYWLNFTVESGVSYYTFNISQALTVSTDTDKLGDIDKSLSQSIGFSDSSQRLGDFFTLSSQTFIINNIANKLSALMTRISQLFSFTSSIDSFALFLREKSQTFSIGNIASRFFSGQRETEQLIQIIDLNTRLRFMTITTEETITLTELVDRLFIGVRTKEEAITLTDLLARARERTITEEQAIQLSDLIDRLLQAKREQSESFSLTTTISRLFVGFRNIQQDIEIATTVVKSAIARYIENIAQSLGISDVVDRTIVGFRNFQEALSFSDTLVRFRSKMMDVTQTFSIALKNTWQSTLTREFSLNIGLNDLLNRLFIGNRETEQLFQLSDLNDRLKHATITNEEVIQLSDSINKLFIGDRYSKQLIQINDLLFKYRARTITAEELLQLTDLVDRLVDYKRSLLEQVSFTDIVKRLFIGTRTTEQGITVNNVVARTGNFFKSLWETFIMTLTATKTYVQADVSATARISPLLPVNTSILEGWCNGTTKGGENVTYYWRWYNGSDLFSSGDEEGESGSWCYQETANVSTSCGGLSTGNYGSSGNWINLSNTYDGNLDTYGKGNEPGTPVYLYINYTKPTNALNSSLWQVKDGIGIVNLSISLDCWNYDADKLVLRVESYAPSPPENWIKWYCYNNSNEWNQLRYSSDTYYVYEEAMWWNISGTDTTYHLSGEEVNLANITANNTNVGETWTFSCNASNGTSSSGWVNTSVTLSSSFQQWLSQTFSFTAQTSRIGNNFRNLIQALTIENIADKTSSLFRKLQESFNINTIITTLGNRIRELYQSFSMNTATSRFFKGFRNAQQTFNIPSIITRIFTGQREASQLLQLTDLNSRMRERTITQAELITFTDLIDRLFKGIRTEEEAITISELLFRYKAKTITEEELIQLTDLINKLLDAKREISQSTIIGQLINRQVVLFRTATQQIQITLDLWTSGMKAYLQEIIQALNIDTAIDRTGSFFKNLQNGFDINTITSRIIDRFKNIQQLLNINNLVSRLFIGQRESTQLLQISDSADRLRFVTIKPSEALQLQDSINRYFAGQRDSTLLIEINDLLSRARDRKLTIEESLQLSDLINRLLNSERTAYQPLSFLQSIKRLFVGQREANELLQISALSEKARDRTITQSELLQLSDLVNKYFEGDRYASLLLQINQLLERSRTRMFTIDESIQLSDLVDRLLKLKREQLQGISFIDIIKRFFVGERTTEQLLEISLLNERMKARTITASELLQLEDLISRHFIGDKYAEQLIQINELLARARDRMLSIEESLQLADLIDRLLNAKREQLQDISFIDSIRRLFVGERGINQLFSMDNFANKYFKGFRDFQQNISLDTLTSKLANLKKSIQQTFNINNIINRLFRGQRESEQLLEISLFNSKLRKIEITTEEAIQLQNSINKMFKGDRHAEQLIQINDLFSRFFDRTITNEELIGLSDSINRLLNAYRTQEQGFSLLNTADRFFTGFRSIADTLNINNIASKVRDVFKEIAETFSIDTITDRLFKGFRNLQQNISFDITASRVGVFARNIQQSITNAMSIAIQTAEHFFQNIVQTLNIDTATARAGNFVRNIFQAISSWSDMFGSWLKYYLLGEEPPKETGEGGTGFAGYCGDGYCNTGRGENEENCPQDCLEEEPKTKPTIAGIFRRDYDFIVLDPLIKLSGKRVNESKDQEFRINVTQKTNITYKIENNFFCDIGKYYTINAEGIDKNYVECYIQAKPYYTKIWVSSANETKAINVYVEKEQTQLNKITGMLFLGEPFVMYNSVLSGWLLTGMIAVVLVGIVLGLYFHIRKRRKASI